ncbi:MAG: ribulose-phosphate 3-epimerase [Melioribacteraceae bacterium]|nr:ribulose-phosphate 3-epimerase [Melioribacteraceae bacterium]MCF8265074.1 ribulose-phosphate 3-epimerase [Melioribacteraceae bacterium]MCF8413351.1 ribulose-phosphate 3-epimerase [Melioribacteraceae bacterium]
MKFIAPSILASDFSNLSKQIRSVEMGGADLIHCDIMDGKFVPNISFGPVIVNAVNQATKLPLDVHLMIEKPDDYLEAFVKAGADSLTVHQEEVVHLHRTISKIKQLGAKAGVALNPSTPLESLSEILHELDHVLIMSVNPGFGGQKFIENSVSKISRLSEMRKKHRLHFLIQVDGGIDSSNIKKVSDSGCDVFIAGSSVFGAENITAAVIELKNLID